MPIPGESAGVGESTPAPKRTNPYVTSQQQRSAEQEAQKRLGETVTLPKPKPFVLDATVPVASTGEPYNEWLGRRFDLALGSLPRYGPGFALQVAASPISDPELKHLSRMANIAGTHEFVQAFITGPAQQGAVAEIKARLDALTEQDMFLIHQDTGIDPKLIDVQKLKDLDPRITREILDALKTIDPKPFWRRNLVDPLSQAASNVSQFFLGEQGRLPGTELDPNAQANLQDGILEEAYRSATRPTFTAGIATLESAKQIGGTVTELVDELTPGRLPESWHRPEKPPDLREIYSNVVEMGPGRATAFHAGIDPDSSFGHILSGSIDFASRIFVDPIGPATSVARGYKLAKVLPKGGGVPLRGLARATYLDLALSPEELIQTPRWAKVRRGIWRDVQKIRGFGALPANLEDTGEELLHGTSRSFDVFQPDVPNRYGRPGTKGFYFTDKPEVARRFAESEAFDYVDVERFYESLDEEATKGLSALREALTDAERGGRRIEVVGEDGAWHIRKASQVTPSDLRAQAVRVSRPGVVPTIRKERVYGRTLDLRDPKNVPTEVTEELRRLGYDITARLSGVYFQHERVLPKLVQYARAHGYGKIRVKDAYESGFESVIALPEYIGEFPGRAARLAATQNVKRANVYRLVDSWALPPGLGDEILAVAGPDELDDVIVKSMRGIQSGVTRQAYEARLVRAKEALGKARAEVEDVHIGGPVTGKSAKDLPELESTVRGAEQMISSLEKILASGKAAPGTIIRELPSTGIMRTVRNTLKRPSEDKPFGALVSFFSDDDWARKALPAHGRVPHKPISLDPADLQDAARDFSDVGQLYGLSRNQIDDFTSRFIRATTDSEARDAYVDMLKQAKGNLPKGIGEELTQYIDNISGNGYWIDADGRSLQGWDKVVSRLGSDQRYFMPIFDSQLARALPLPDLRKVIESRSYIGRLEQTLKGIRGTPVSQFFARTPGVDKLGQALGFSIQQSRELMGAFTSAFWIPSVLIRLGWTGRVIIDEQLRLVASGVNPLEENLLSLLGKSTLDEIPERSLGTYSRIPVRARPISSFAPLRKGEKGYASALQEDLVFLHNDHLARYIATHTDDEVKAFLKTPEGAYFAERWSHVLQAGGKTTDEWIAVQRQAIEATVGKSPELREAVRRGYINLNRSVRTTVRGKLREVSKVRIDSEHGQLAIRQLLESAPATLPNAARGTGEFFIRTDPSIWRRGTAQVMELLGTKPTRALSRRPAYKFWYRNELARLKGLGVDDALASETARQYAIKQVGQILYDSAERTAGELMVHNLSPFLPAWKEVFTRWLYTIPSQSGLGIGHANIVRRLQVLFNALKDEGLLVQNLEGDWEIRSSGIDKALRWYYQIDPTKFTRPDGTKGELAFHAGIPIRNANILGNWPGFGPLPTLGFKQIVEKSEKWDAVLRNFYPYGVDGSLGPRTWSRILRGIGLDPPWDIFDAKYQQTLSDFSVIDVMRARQPEIDKIRAMPGNTPAQQELKLKAFRDFVDSAEAQAGSVMVRRGFLGLLLPVQPRNYWPGQEEVAAFRESLEEMDPTTKKTAYAEFLDDHPELALSFVAKTERIANEVERESFEDRSRNDLRRELLSGNIKAIPPERWAEAAIGDINYQTIRRKEREELSDLGSTGADWLRKGAEYVRIRNEADAAIERLKVEDQQLFHGSWQQYYQASLNRAADRKGLPRPTLEETYARGLARTLGVIRSIIPLDPLDEASRDGQAAISRFRRELYKAANLDAYYRDEELPPGPERDIARYYSQVDEYWKQVEDIAKNYTSEGHTAARIAEGHLMRQRLRNNHKPVVIGEQVQTVTLYVSDPKLATTLNQAVSIWNKALGEDIVVVSTTSATGAVPVVFGATGTDDVPAFGEFDPKNRRIIVSPKFYSAPLLAHEIGHALGLDHSEDTDTLMGGDVQPSKQELSQVRKRFVTGVTYPHPEEAAFLSQTPDEQRRRKMAWVYSPMAWLAPYQRKALGLDQKRTPKAVEFWDDVSQARYTVTQFIQSKGWPPGKEEARNLREYLEAYETQLADYYGVKDEYRFSKLPNYKRMAHFKDLHTSDSWKRVRQGADAAWDALKLSEVGPLSTYGRQLQISFATWLNGLREDDKRLDKDLEFLQNAAPSFVGKSLDDPDRGFYAWLFFTEGK